MPLLPKQYLDAVVSIEVKTEEGKFRPLATGFLAGFFIGEFDEDKNKLYKTFLITNRHVFEKRQQAYLRFNFTKGGSKRYKLTLKDGEKDLWFTHPNRKIDIAVIPIPIKRLEKEGIEYYFFTDDENMVFKGVLKQLMIAQGDEVFVLGFPMGITGEGRNYVIVRSGIIARLDEEIINNYFKFLIDSSILPGNSGGPVILKPTITSLNGTKPVSKAYLLGVISGHIPYREKAISVQTGETRVTFVENSGLATVVPLDFVKEIIDTFLLQTKQEKIIPEKASEPK